MRAYIRENREPWTQVVDQVNRIERGFLQIPEVPGVGMSLNLEHLRHQARYEPFGQKFAHGALRGADGGVRHQ